jgi:tetratricopeptide (TPR) repeat protein
MVVTEVDSRRIESSDSFTAIELESFVYALNQDAEVVGRASQRLTVDPNTESGTLASTAIKIVIPLELPSGRYQIRALVTQTGTDRFGVASSELLIPTASVDSSAWSSPWLAEPPQDWTVVTPAEGLGSTSGSIYLFDRAGELHIMAAHPVVVTGGFLTGGFLTVGGGVDDVLLVARILRADGLQIAEAPLDLVRTTPAGRAGTENAVFQLQVPSLPPAAYELSVTGRATEDAPQAPVVRFSTVEPELSSTLASWTRLEPTVVEVATTSGQARARTLDPRDLKRSIDVTQDEILAAYVSVYDTLAKGLRLEARADLREFEIEALKSRSPIAIPDLERSQFQALRNLAEDRGASLLPIAVVYAELIGDYHRRGLAPLSEHALKMSTELTEPIARGSKRGLSEQVAADVLVSVAGYAILASRRTVGEDLLEAALRLEPEHEAALMSLAASREQKGRYSDAAETLGQLAEAHPDNREGRLRLAVNLERLKQSDRALEIYRDLETSGHHDWVELVAIDQSAALYARRGLSGEAESILRGAIERWPNIPALQVQLAWLLDESNQLDAASEIVEGLLSTSGSTSESPRYRYNHWHSYVFDESRKILAALVQRYASEFETTSSPGEGGASR